MEGAGNDYVYVNCFEEKLPAPPERLAGRAADRHFGIGGDGLVLILPSDKADARMRMFNPDGTEAEMCGNAVRCVAKYIHDHGICGRDRVTIETGKGVLTLDCFVENGLVNQVKVDMGEPILVPSDVPTLLRSTSGGETDPAVAVPLALGDRTVPATCVSMGNPHCVVFVDEPTDEWVLGIGPEIEKCASFPRRTNVEFIQVLSPDQLKMRVWERGTGETLACGTGACASGVAAVLNGKANRKVTIHLLGGDLEIEWAEENHVMMTGPATEVFSGDWSV